jgi:hypothetical protein
MKTSKNSEEPQEIFSAEGRLHDICGILFDLAYFGKYLRIFVLILRTRNLLVTSRQSRPQQIAGLSFARATRSLSASV